MKTIQLNFLYKDVVISSEKFECEEKTVDILHKFAKEVLLSDEIPSNGFKLCKLTISEIQ